MNSTIDSLSAKPMALFGFFIVLFTLDPLFFGVMMLVTLGADQALSIAKILLILAPPILAALAIYVYLISRRLTQTIAGLDTDTVAADNQAMEAQINSYAFKTALCMFIGNSGGPMLVGILGIVMNVLFSLQQAIFFIVAGQFEAIVAALLMYYLAKKRLSPLGERVAYRPLSLYFKFSIPIVTVLMTALIITGVAIYLIAFSMIQHERGAELKLYAQQTTHALDEIITEKLTPLKTQLATRIKGDINFDQLAPMLAHIAETRDTMIEIYFIAKPDGMSLNTLGGMVNIADRPYFQRLLRDKETVVSEPITSRATGKEVIVSVSPILSRDGQLMGVIGATITIEGLKAFLVKRGSEGGYGHLLIHRSGRIVSAHDAGFVNRIVGKDLREDGSVNQGLDALMKKGQDIVRITLEKKPMLAAVAPLGAGGDRLVVVLEQDRFYSGMNPILIQIVILLVILFSAMMGTIFLITKRVSEPIHRVSTILDDMARGDFSQRYNDRLDDELGLLTRSLNTSLDNVSQMIDSVNATSRTLAQTVEEITASNLNLSSRTTEQASSLEELAATIEQSAATINQNADHAARARELTSVGASKSSLGNSIAAEAVTSIGELNEASRKIAEITNLINDIAFQTNLLALNAAVEAARAGDQGRGFAVVAGEVRNLAQRSGNAAQEIGVLIRNAIDKITRSTELVNRTGASLSEIAAAADETMRLMNEIATATMEQKNGIDQINQAISELDGATQQNASLVEETASASEQMSHIAEDLISLVGRFTIRIHTP